MGPSGKGHAKRSLRSILPIAMLSAAAALFVGPTNAAAAPFGSVELCANEGGTCCDGAGTCYPNDCSSSECSQPNAYWSGGGPC